MNERVGKDSPLIADWALRDDVLRPLIEAAVQDDGTIGLILHGSRGRGAGDEASDYDLLRLLSEEAFEARFPAGIRSTEAGHGGDGKKVWEVGYETPGRLRSESAPEWFIRGLVTGVVLFDRTGESQALLDQLALLHEDQARELAAPMLDAYLNGFYRSMKAARRGDELGARLHSAESLTFLAQALFAMERRHAPFHDHLIKALRELASQQWKTDELEELFVAILCDCDPHVQAALEERVEALAFDRGYGSVVEGWGQELEREKQALD